MSMVGFPLLIPLAICNIIVFLMPGVTLAEPIARLTLISGAEWPLSLSDILLVLGIGLLLLEIIKGARPGAKYLTDHLLSLIVFVALPPNFCCGRGSAPRPIPADVARAGGFPVGYCATRPRWNSGAGRCGLPAKRPKARSRRARTSLDCASPSTGPRSCAVGAGSRFGRRIRRRRLAPNRRSCKPRRRRRDPRRRWRHRACNLAEALSPSPDTPQR